MLGDHEAEAAQSSRPDVHSMHAEGDSDVQSCMLSVKTKISRSPIPSVE